MYIVVLSAMALLAMLDHYLHTLCMSKNAPSDARLLQTQLKVRALGLRQKDIAEAIGVSQSQVSRVLGGRSSSRSALLSEIVRYADGAIERPDPAAVRKNEILISALSSVWDGTESHAIALASVIRSLSLLNPSGATQSTNDHEPA